MEKNFSTELPFKDLSPDVVLQAVESFGFPCDGSVFALNSYENRVYQIGIEEQSPIIAKFYRPLRWTNETILEEHQFSLELHEHEIPVIAPIVNKHGDTLQEYNGYRVALFPRQGGRYPDLEKGENLEWIGRFLGRIHAIGKIKPFHHRLTLSASKWGEESIDFLIDNKIIPMELESQYKTIANQVISIIHQIYDVMTDIQILRLHGDCHMGNILWTEQGPHFVDLDDCCSGPAIQDLWMLLTGDYHQSQNQLHRILDGYRLFSDFNPKEFKLIEALRTLRMIHYSSWLARRWNDPAFPITFTWFGTNAYWQEQIHLLEEQSIKLQDTSIV